MFYLSFILDTNSIYKMKMIKVLESHERIGISSVTFYCFTIFLFPNAAKDLRIWKGTTKLGTMAAVSVSKVV